MLFAFAVAVATGVLFGLAPAIQATRPNLTGGMKEGGHGSTSGSGGRRMRASLVVAEVALAFVLLVGAGLMMRSVFALLDMDPGYDSSNVLTAALPIATTQYPDPVALNAYLDSIRAALEGAPGVTGVALTTALPLQGWGYGMPYQVAGRDVVDRASRPTAFFKMVTPSYFATLGINLRTGRTLSETDTAGAPPVAVINETFAKHEFADVDPIGQRLLVQQIIPGQTGLGEEIGWEIVGVIADEKIGGLDDTGSGGMYVSYRQSPAYGMRLAVRAAIDADGFAGNRACGHRFRQQGPGVEPRADARADRARLDVGRARPKHPLRRLRHDRAAAGRRRHLRSHLLLGRSAHARNGHPVRARRERCHVAASRVSRRHAARRDRSRASVSRARSA